MNRGTAPRPRGPRRSRWARPPRSPASSSGPPTRARSFDRGPQRLSSPSIWPNPNHPRPDRHPDGQPHHRNGGTGRRPAGRTAVAAPRGAAGGGRADPGEPARRRAEGGLQGRHPQRAELCRTAHAERSRPPRGPGSADSAAARRLRGAPLRTRHHQDHERAVDRHAGPGPRSERSHGRPCARTRECPPRRDARPGAPPRLRARCPGQVDPVVWVNIGFHHVARDEDQQPMPVHRQGFRLAPGTQPL